MTTCRIGVGVVVEADIEIGIELDMDIDVVVWNALPPKGLTSAMSAAKADQICARPRAGTLQLSARL